MKNANDFHPVSDTVVNDMGSFGKLAVAWIDLIAGIADQTVLTDQYKGFIKLPKVVVSLCSAPPALRESTNPEQILSCGPGDPKLAFSHLGSRPVPR